MILWWECSFVLIVAMRPDLEAKLEVNSVFSAASQMIG